MKPSSLFKGISRYINHLNICEDLWEKVKDKEIVAHALSGGIERAIVKYGEGYLLIVFHRPYRELFIFNWYFEDYDYHIKKVIKNKNRVEDKDQIGEFKDWFLIEHI